MEPKRQERDLQWLSYFELEGFELGQRFESAPAPLEVMTSG
jgi:hypothetical protein